MRLRRRLCGLILVALVLLLSAASPSPQPSPKQQSRKPLEAHDKIGRPTTLAVIQPSSQNATQVHGSPTYNYYYPAKGEGDSSAWLEAGATIGLLIFAFLQMRFIRRTTEATEKASEAARDAVQVTKEYVKLTEELARTTKQSVELARLSLSAYRPFIMVEQITAELLQIAYPEDDIYRLAVTVRVDSCGNGPAVINRVTFAKREAVILGKFEQPRWPFGKDWKESMGSHVLPAGSKHVFEDGTLGFHSIRGSSVKRMIRFDQQIALIGRIDYSDAFGKKFFRDFCWFYNAGTKECYEGPSEWQTGN